MKTFIVLILGLSVLMVNAYPAGKLLFYMPVVVLYMPKAEHFDLT
jgi:hypothetical protein